MALLQNDKAIFYHPCDDSTEALKSQAWTESTPTYPAGKVSLGLGPTALDPSFGTKAEFTTGTPNHISVAALSATKFVVAYRDGSAGNIGQAQVGTVSGTDVTLGAKVTFRGTSGSDYISVAALSSAKIVIAYNDTAEHGKAKVGTVSGTDIMFGAEATFLGANGAHNISAAGLSGTACVVAYRDFSDSNHSKTKIGTVTGTSIVFGAESEFTVTYASVISVAAFGASKFVVGWRQSVGGGKVRIGIVSGTDITLGAEATFISGASQMSVTVLDASKFVATWRESSVAGAKVGTVSGSSVTFGAQATFDGSGVQYILASTISATKFILEYDNGGSGEIRVGTVSGTDITFDAGTEFSSTVASESYTLSSAGLSQSVFVVAYRDSSATRGTVNAGIMPTGSSLTASTPAAYDTAAAATKVAFAGWLKNPSA